MTTPMIPMTQAKRRTWLVVCICILGFVGYGYVQFRAARIESNAALMLSALRDVGRRCWSLRSNMNDFRSYPNSRATPGLD